MSRWLFTFSAAVLAALGIAASFAPQELLGAFGAPPAAAAVLAVQLLGAAWLALAMLDWMSRGAVIGGIYGRPLVVANLTGFAISTIVVAKLVLQAPDATLAILLGVFALPAAGFGWSLFNPPAQTPRG